MAKSRTNSKSKPAGKRKATDVHAVRTPRDPAADVLRILEDDEVPLRRRFMMAKSCLKHYKQHTHRQAAIKVLHLVVESTGRIISDKARDLATRLLLKHDPPAQPKMIILPISFKGLIGGLPQHITAKWVEDLEFMKIPQKEKFPEDQQ